VCGMRTTKTLKALLLPFVAMVASMVAPTAQAIPIDYTAQFTGTLGGSFGGSFTWDVDTGMFSNFVWSLPGSLVEAPDTLTASNWNSPLLGGTTGRFLYEILTGEDLHPSACSTGGRCTFTSIRVNSSLVNSVEFRTLTAGVTDYFFRNGSNVVFSGTVAVSRVAVLVSEPFTLLLMGAGLVGFALRQRLRN
jgi:PEP-CTERM motif